jgi:Ca2+/Na+ antiporter
MSTAVALIAVIAGVVLVVSAADVFVDGLLGVGGRLGVAPFVLTVARSGFETENLAAGIATNAKGLPGAAAGTFLGGITFLALGVAGLGGLISPMQVALPGRFAAWTAAAPLPLLAFGLDGWVSRLEGGLLVLWFAIALIGAARSGRGLLAGKDDEARSHRGRRSGSALRRVSCRRGRPDVLNRFDFRTGRMSSSYSGSPIRISDGSGGRSRWAWSGGCGGENQRWATAVGTIADTTTTVTSSENCVRSMMCSVRP